ncbi:MAG: FGGY family carbohydrate kinase, partial [Bacteroidota bacterium]
MYLLGYDIGSSSIKAALVDARTGHQVAVVQSPDTEMDMIAKQMGWAEQHPETWWNNICLATKQLLQKTNVSPIDIKSIGIAYQMHGLVLVDKQGDVIRPAIIWCDSRAVEIGDRAFAEIGNTRCLTHLLNSPGNFTASKLKWVKDNEPELFERIHKIMLPGDYIAMKLTGEIVTTISGLSEGVLWDFEEGQPASLVLDHYKVDASILPEIKPTFSVQGLASKKGAL